MADLGYGQVLLRPWRQDETDTRALIDIAQGAHVQEWLKDWAGVEEWAGRWIEGQAWRHEKAMPQEEFMGWAITIPPSDTPIGFINLGGDETDHKALSLGYALHEDALHKGIATEAVLALCAYVFDRWGVDEMFASVRVENEASAAVLKRAGFEWFETRPTEVSGYDQDVLCAWYRKRK